MDYAYRFSIILKDIMKVNSNGFSTYTFTPANLTIPSQYVKPGIASTLPELVSSIPANYLSFSYQIAASGFIEGHTCSASSTLFATLTVNKNNKLRPIKLATTESSPNNGTTLCTGWLDVQHTKFNIPYSGSGLPSQLATNQICLGPGCTTPVCITNVWNDISISLKIDVSIINTEYCIQNPHNLDCILTPLPSRSFDTFSNIQDIDHHSYWRRNRTAIIWFTVIIIVIIIVLAIVFASDKKKWFTRKYNK